MDGLVGRLRVTSRLPQYLFKYVRIYHCPKAEAMLRIWVWRGRYSCDSLDNRNIHRRSRASAVYR